MPYSISFTDEANKGTITVEDNTLNTQTSLAFPGRGFTGYASYIAENFLHILENFSSTVAPVRPTDGQLWYDQNSEQLKIYDGVSWVPSGGLNKAPVQPDVNSSKDGDLWVDTDNKQLYLRSNQDWILIGPDFSEGLATGASPRQITGTDNQTYTVSVLEVQTEIVAIISSSSFTPKATIPGFISIKPGMNIRQSQTGNFSDRLWGVSETAESLYIQGDKINAGNFLRSDTTSNTQFPLNIRNNFGLTLGSDSALKIGVEGQAGILEHQIEGSSIDIRVKRNGASQTALRIDSSKRLGINNEAPDESLDVIGNVKIQPDINADTPADGKLLIEGTRQSDTINDASFVTKGGASVAKNLRVGGTTFLNQIRSEGSLIPLTNRSYSLGSSTNKWQFVYGERFIGSLEGSVSGSVSGQSGSAKKLTNATTFRITGDLESDPFAFDGETGGNTKTFDVSLKNSVVGTKEAVFTSQGTDELLINRIEGEDTGLYKISTQRLLRTIPTNPPGVVMPYVGDVAPAGWEFCDGEEYRQSDYPDLFAAIGFKFGGASTVRTGYFRVPDFRGRLPLGADNMGGNSANVTTSTYADFVGAKGGSESVEINIENLPDHEHDLRSEADEQFFAIRNDADTPASDDVEDFDAPTSFGNAQGLRSSGGVVSPDDNLGQSLNIMNPTLTVNYIIYMGRDD